LTNIRTHELTNWNVPIRRLVDSYIATLIRVQTGKLRPAAPLDARKKAASVHSLRGVSGLKTGTQPDLAPETDDPICVMREGKPSIDGTGRGYFRVRLGLDRVS
jgi:hypothetical protein